MTCWRNSPREWICRRSPIIEPGSRPAFDVIHTTDAEVNVLALDDQAREAVIKQVEETGGAESSGLVTLLLRFAPKLASVGRSRRSRTTSPRRAVLKARSRVKAEGDDAKEQGVLSAALLLQGDVPDGTGRACGRYACVSESLELRRAWRIPIRRTPAGSATCRSARIKIGDVLLDQGDLAGALRLPGIAGGRRASGVLRSVERRLAERPVGQPEQDRGRAACPGRSGRGAARTGNRWRLPSLAPPIRRTPAGRGTCPSARTGSGTCCCPGRSGRGAAPTGNRWRLPTSCVLRSVERRLAARPVGEPDQDRGRAACPGRLAGALTAYRESLAAPERLASSDPSNAGWQRGPVGQPGRIGDVLLAQGDLAGALRLPGIAGVVDAWRPPIRRTPAAGDLSVSQIKIGDVLLAQGDLAGVVRRTGNRWRLKRRLASSDPSNAGWQRDLSVILTRLAEYHEQQGEGAAALSLAQESLSIDERLFALDPTNVTWQNDVAVSRTLVARLRRGSG